MSLGLECPSVVISAQGVSETTACGGEGVPRESGESDRRRWLSASGYVNIHIPDERPDLQEDLRNLAPLGVPRPRLFAAGSQSTRGRGRVYSRVDTTYSEIKID